MSDAQSEFITEFNRIQRGVKTFADEMRAKGIHVGMGAKPLARCVCCGEPWPCTASKRAPDA